MEEDVALLERRFVPQGNVDDCEVVHGSATSLQ
jgi:hypothetical protein